MRNDPSEESRIFVLLARFIPKTMSKFSKTTNHPWIFGPFAVYAQSPLIARQVYDRLRADPFECEPFGIVTLEDGEQVEWVNMKAEVIRQTGSD
jgi:hypothetical protein